MKIGDKVTVEKIFDQSDVLLYTGLSKDTNPIHYDKNYSKKTIFGNNIVPGLLVAGLFGGLLGSKLPGKGTIHLGQSLKFKNPIYINEKIKAEIEIINIRKDKPIITFKTICYKKDNKIAIEGEAVVKI